MLTIKDLTASKELDSKEMASVAGGNGIPAFLLNIGSPVNAPKLADLMGIATSSTGEQLNTNVQSDNDYNVVIGSGQVINSGGNHNWTTQNSFRFRHRSRACSVTSFTSPAASEGMTREAASDHGCSLAHTRPDGNSCLRSGLGLCICRQLLGGRRCIYHLSYGR